MVTETIEVKHVKYSEWKMGIPPFLKWVGTRETGRREWCRREDLEMPHLFLHDPYLTGSSEQSDKEGLFFLCPQTGYFLRGKEARFSDSDFHKSAQMC